MIRQAIPSPVILPTPDPTGFVLRAAFHAPRELVWDACALGRHLARWRPGETVAIRGGVPPMYLLTEARQPPGERGSRGGPAPREALLLRALDGDRTLAEFRFRYRSPRSRDRALRTGEGFRALERIARLHAYLEALGWGPEPEGEAAPLLLGFRQTAPLA